ncbi:glutamate racemase [Lactobacillus kunkeei]|uniref:glutamate racemase n=1 Tax=Apilactobacillus kunkeei TaxID=148814 RepID=UPI001364231D|nr:glutamate racemase [Apilactobacillus kunkeei]NBI00004.1 glutamate racemase [Apilactobacillus kunkeei]CAI2587757.1 Glutamate racemase [Apilactobacillus kunkeei]CAI2588175.1 Glutamate racemase [Apilactobacillus kunkeei]
MSKKAIGFMDSGVGGLTVAKLAMKELQNENIAYLGDEARLPYGEKSKEEIQQYSLQIANFLIEKEDIKMLVIACNTATSYALDYLRKHLFIPVIGVVNPGSIAAVNNTKTNRVGLIATNGTVKSGAYEKEINKINNNIEVFSQGCPRFVPMVEKQEYKDAKKQEVVDDDLSTINMDNVDTLILGCTHFPIMREMIQKSVGDSVKLIDPGYETVKQIKTILQEHHLENDEKGDAIYSFYTTGDSDNFNQVANEWLNYEVHAKHLPIKELEEL